MQLGRHQVQSQSLVVPVVADLLYKKRVLEPRLGKHMHIGLLRSFAAVYVVAEEQLR